MLEKWQKRLVFINIAVFLGVLAIFCAAVYCFGCSAFDDQLRDKLRSIADSAISSIDFDDYGQSHNGKPDLIVSVLPNEASPALNNMRIQWFDTSGRLDIEKGLMALSVPFERQETFQWQSNPPALVFTKPAIANGKLLGYVRVGHPLAEIKKQRALLLQCLVFGALVAVTASGIGVFLLIRQSLRPVEESIEHLQQFCADAAHELLTPITAIRTNSNVALRHPDGMRESDKEKFEAIASGALQVEKLTGDLLMLAKAEQLVEKSRIDSALTPLDLAEHIEDVLEQVTPGAEKKSLKLKNDAQEHLYVFMEGDDLNCVLKNLLDNAIKYTPNDGTVSICASPSNGGIQITVTDSGIGIEKEDLPKVFDRFWRADQARSYHSGGNGLGLPIVKAIIDKYDGTIAVTSEPGKRTEFRIDIKGGKASFNGKGN